MIHWKNNELNKNGLHKHCRGVREEMNFEQAQQDFRKGSGEQNIREVQEGKGKYERGKGKTQKEREEGCESTLEERPRASSRRFWQGKCVTKHLRTKGN